jgi:hypothetical protein
MVARKLLPESLRSGPFAVEDARELGVPAKRLRALDLESPFRGVRTDGLDWSDIDQVCATFAVCLGPEQLFSHVTAARLYQIPLPWRLQSRRAIDVWAPTIQVRADGVIGHRSAPLTPAWVRGMPVVTPARTWVQLGALVDRVSLIAAGDDLVRRKRPLSTLTELADAVDSSKGVRGIRALRAALAEVRPGTDSPMETRLRLLLTDAGLPEPVIGHTIRDWTGGFVGTPDLAYVHQRIAIEYEGDGHRSDPGIFADDIERRERMQEAGWYVIRVIKDHVFRKQAWLVDRVRRQLRERADLPSSVL